jgi:hypothetical protein
VLRGRIGELSVPICLPAEKPGGCKDDEGERDEESEIGPWRRERERERERKRECVRADKGRTHIHTHTHTGGTETGGRGSTL